jgi:hypothetical protein|tara:strand:- start:65 stop:367 length:303 start_codon:yes stop_codon:yes gene_type:complete
MKVLRAKEKRPNIHSFKISDLKIQASRAINDDVVKTGVMLHPIEIRDRRDMRTDNLRYGGAGALYVHKDYDVWRGNSRVKAAIDMGYTHIEGVFLDGRSL